MEINFSLSSENAQRLFAIKKLQGLDNMTGGDFARRLLEQELYRLFPAIPERDENGEIINASVYRGGKS